MSRYKELTLNKVEQMASSINRLEFEINRGEQQDNLLESVSKIKERLEEIRSLISIEHDEFAQQFTQ